MVPARSLPAVSDFPPQDLRSFLEFCAGDWLSVRSSFALDAADRVAAADTAAGTAEPAEPEAPEESWHGARRGELAVTYLSPEQEGDPGGLEVTPPAAGEGAPARRRLQFQAAGAFVSWTGPERSQSVGSWRFWPDGSLELTRTDAEAVVRERIWFTKPNLRLRSSIEQRHDGRPARASFSSEIRRVSRGAAAVGS
jgi:hypothetical protein